MTYFRPSIDAMQGYIPGEQPQQTGFIKLNTNENPYPPSPRVIEAIHKTATDRLRLYPDPVARNFCESAGKLLGVSADSVLATNGSDEALTILMRACVGEGRKVVAPLPSYGLYGVLADIQGCCLKSIPWQPDGSLPSDFTAGASLALITNPNSPTGTMLPPATLLKMAEQASCLVVADEAYADFAPVNSVPDISQCERLVVTRTLSKSYSLAGLRFGFIVADPKVIATLMKVKDSYNVDAISIAAATAAIEDRTYFDTCRQKVLATRDRLETALAKLGFTVTPSQANFVWIERNDPLRPIYESLKEQKILIRYFHLAANKEGLRISVGTDAEIDACLDAMARM
ncbi:histidinol-phosphate transaminase [bacterium]|jgi:histidinol-phosphate aminotransferase|nr:histidinol-phosphate transaminase [bacterium]